MMVAATSAVAAARVVSPVVAAVAISLRQQQGH